jgi:soluble lytic murein transglycosylase-like protein
MRLEPTTRAYAIGLAVLLLGALIIAFVAFKAPRSVPAPASHPSHAPHRTTRQAVVPKPSLPPPAPVSAFALEQQMTPRELLRRWDPTIAEASVRFHVPEPWIRAVMVAESGGHTMAADNQPLISSKGAMGLMQLMPDTYADMRAAYGFGADPQNPHDNILAGTAFLRRLFLTYGFPMMFSAYNDGPGNLEYRLLHRELLPLETRNYVEDITRALLGGRALHGAHASFTRPDGTPVMIDVATVVQVRAALPGEYAPGVRTVITMGRLRQGVREAPDSVKSILRKHGGI